MSATTYRDLISFDPIESVARRRTMLRPAIRIAIICCAALFAACGAETGDPGDAEEVSSALAAPVTFAQVKCTTSGVSACKRTCSVSCGGWITIRQCDCASIDCGLSCVSDR